MDSSLYSLFLEGHTDQGLTSLATHATRGIASAIDLPPLTIGVDASPTTPQTNIYGRTITPDVPGPENISKANLTSDGQPPDNSRGLWEVLTDVSKQGLGEKAFALSKGLEVYGTLKGAFDAKEDAYEQATQLERSAQGIRERYQRRAQDVLDKELNARAADQQALAASGLNFGAIQHQAGQAFDQVQAESLQGAQRRAEDLRAEGRALADERIHQATIARKKGRKAKTRGILAGVGDLAATGASVYLGGGVGPALGIASVGDRLRAPLTRTLER